MTTQTTAPQATSPQLQTSTLTPGPGTRESATLTVRARSTCSGAHVHVGDLKLRHEEVSDFAGRYQARPAVSTLTKLTSSAVNDMKGILAARMGLRIHAVTATAIVDQDAERAQPAVALRLEIESPEEEAAVERLVKVWRQEYSAAALPEGIALEISWRVLDWYGG